MFGLIKKILNRLFTSIVNASNHTKCVSLRRQKCKEQPILFNLHPNKYTQGLRYYPFAVNLEKCVGIFNSINDVSNKVRVPNKTEDLNLSMFNMTTGINKSKTFTKHISYECKCKFDSRKCNSDQKWNSNKSCV